MFALAVWSCLSYHKKLTMNMCNISTYFTDGYRVGYGEWNAANSSFTTTLRYDYTPSLRVNGGKYALTFKLPNAAQPPSQEPDIRLEVDVHGSGAVMTQGFTNVDMFCSSAQTVDCNCDLFWRPWPASYDPRGFDRQESIKMTQSVPRAMSLSQTSLLA